MKGQARDIIRAAQVLLQDDGTRWSARELVGWLNEAQRLIVAARPDLTATTVTFAPEAGARQQIPDDAARLLEVRCNSNGKLRAMTQVDRYALESVSRDWQSEPQRDVLLHYMPSTTEPRVFYVYPPASGQARVELTYSRYPDTVPTPGTDSAEAVTGQTAIDQAWNGTLLDYVMYRAWLKDAEHGANAQVAAGYMNTFTAALSVSTKS